MKYTLSSTRLGVLATGLMLSAAMNAAAQPAPQCARQSGTTVASVVELYTSEGCSSCPPADRWLSAQTPGPTTVIQAFHVGYWNHLGWIDRFSNPIHTARQKQIAAWNGQSTIYTPQMVRNGRDWRDWSRSSGVAPAGTTQPALVSIVLRQTAADDFEADVTTLPGGPDQWSAYWSSTEDGHTSRVTAGENAGRGLLHDHVVRQYTPAGRYAARAGAAQMLRWRSIAATPGHTRRVNLVVFDERNGQPLQAVSLACNGRS